MKPGREKSLLRRHPWIFSGAVKEVIGFPEAGETVEVFSSDRQFLARAAYSHYSQIVGRVWSWDVDCEIDSKFFKNKLVDALQIRDSLLDRQQSNAIRLVHGEADGLPGYVVDQYEDTAVIQISSAGAERWKDVFIDCIEDLPGVKRIYERSDVDTRQLENLPPRTGTLRGNEPPLRQNIYESNLHFVIDIRHGHKTGFYLDQRNNRLILRNLAKDHEVLDCFSYTGGFTVNALAGGAKSVLAVDSSAEALSMARDNLILNNISPDRVEFINDDVFITLRSLRDRGRSFDMIVLDPPKFAPTIRHVEKAARGYKDINLLAIKLLRTGGLLVTFSCSSGVNEELFKKIGNYSGW